MSSISSTSKGYRQITTVCLNLSLDSQPDLPDGLQLEKCTLTLIIL